MHRLRSIAFFCVTVTLSLSNLAASVAQGEFADAIHSKPNVERGIELFQTCAKCHGPEGGGSRAIGTPEIAGQHFPVIVKQLVDYQHGKRWDIRMEQIAKQHGLTNAQAIADIATYVSELKWKPGGDIGDGELVAHGESVYRQSCQSCHGATAEGSVDKIVPRIAGQHYGYLIREM